MISDRAFFTLSLVLAATACSSGSQLAPAPSGTRSALVVVTPSEPREQTADQQVQQVLNRLAFGPRPGDVAKVREMGVDQWIALQLAPDRIDDRAAERIVASYETLNKPTTELVRMYDEGQLAIRKQQKQEAANGDSGSKKDLRAEIMQGNPQLREQLRQNQRILGDVQSAKLARAVVSERQLDEVMTDFWENHFTVFAGKGLDRIFLPAYDRDVIRPHALGKFRDLLGAVAKSPAMMFYLDQWQSAADSMHPTLVAARTGRGGRASGRPALVLQAQARKGLNENYARELLELHTLGVEGGYTQTDVIEVARALTGWTMNPRLTAEFVFRPEIHDAGQKTVLGHVLPAGRGIEDGEAVLDIVSRSPATAHFIARKLATRFVSDQPPAELVERAAHTFRETDGDIREVVRTIVTSPEFFSRTAYRSKVKSPFELVASAFRAVGAQADTSLRSAQIVGFLGAPIWGHQAPNGWPETGEAWMNSGAILNRINFGLGLAAGRFPAATVSQWSESERLRNVPREQQVDAVVGAFLGGQASPDTRQILMRGENPLAAKLAVSAAPDSASAGMGSMMTGDDARPMRDRPTPPPAKNGAPRAGRGGGAGVLGAQVQLNGLAQVVGLAIGAPEFQRR
ncbi:MAG: hypothetical protein JWM95_4469 [Gemmatimonadetes bacterium]|nr:hypothetical protein [Gemmatimonadota bacterium]